MKVSDEVVEVVVNTIQVPVLCCVYQYGGSRQCVVKSVIGKFLRKTNNEVKERMFLLTSGAQAGNKLPRPSTPGKESRPPAMMMVGTWK